jgi:imidazolonepropionase-like amidohydrolase
MNTNKIAVLPLLSLSLLFAQTDPVVIRGARVIDGTGAPARAVDVVIRAGRIESVGGAAPQAARIIDASGQTLLPGLFDLHTHLTASATRGVPGDWGKNLKAYLASGVTTVNDYATFSEMFVPMKKLLDSGAMPGPHVNMAVRMSSTGGHGTEGGWGDFMTIEANTPAQAHARMKMVLGFKPDVIKVFTDGWRYGFEPDLTSMNLETLAAIVEDAHAAGIKVVTHTVTLRGAKLASRAGVDILVHGIGDAEVDPELIEIMKAKGTSYVSTLAVYEYKGTGDAPPERQQRWRYLTGNVRKLFDAGIPVAVGTDAGMVGTFHGSATLHEFELLAQCGLKPMDTIRAGTSVSARAMGLDAQRGSIAPGKAADLVLVDGRPDEQIADLKKTRMVFVNGVGYTPKDLENQTPMPVHPANEWIDDMERTDGRTSIGTLRVNATDPGIDHSPMLFHPVIRSGTNHALLVQATMADKERPFVRVEFPLTHGSIELADVSRFSGVQFEVRGQSEARLLLQSYGGDPLVGGFPVTSEWETVRVPFTPSTRRDARTLLFELTGPPRAGIWLELDNLRFY